MVPSPQVLSWMKKVLFRHATGVTALQGTATYSGGAAGKYALHSTTGGTNDAGHFTADATLEANFNNDTVSGTIDGFMGADWSVA